MCCQLLFLNSNSLLYLWFWPTHSTRILILSVINHTCHTKLSSLPVLLILSAVTISNHMSQVLSATCSSFPFVIVTAYTHMNIAFLLALLIFFLRVCCCPLLYCIQYLSPLASAVASHGLTWSFYVAKSQIFISFHYFTSALHIARSTCISTWHNPSPKHLMFCLNVLANRL